jgi:ABC-type glycerol-3-phosphate transport system substrate-binding protein
LDRFGELSKEKVQMNTRPTRSGRFLDEKSSRRDLLRRAGVAGVTAPAILGGAGLHTSVAAAQTPGASPAPITPNPDIQGELAIWGWEAAIAALQVVDARFQEAFPNVQLSYVPRPPADTYQQLQLAASAGSGGPDVAIIEDSHLAQFAQLGVLADLTDRVSPYVDIMNGYKWPPATFEDSYYAMPWDSGPVAIFYRRDVFETAGVDPASIKTWDDYYQVATTIKQEAGVPMLQLARARNDGRTFEMMLWQQGLGYVNAEGNVILDTEPKVQQTLEYLGKFWTEELVADTEPWTDPWYKEMADGTVATNPAAVWLGTFLKSFIAPDAAGTWGVIPLPTWEEGGATSSNDGGSQLAIWAQSEQQEAAWAYIEFHLGREESQLTMYKETDLFPSLETTYTDPFFEEPDPYFGDQPVRQLFADIVGQIPEAGIYTADYQEMNGLLVPELQRFAIGDLTAEEALANAAGAIRDRTQRG